MSFAIYGESDAYVHLVSATSESEAIALLLEDVHSVGVELKNVFNVYATEGREECKVLEDYVEKLIESAKNDQ
jgi:hypothetical protein